MRIILESELEKQVWEIMMEAHEKWEKSHGHTLQDMMERYFNEVYKDEIEAVVKREVERRLVEKYGEEEYKNLVGFSENEYVTRALESAGVEDWDEDKMDEMKDELRKKYRNLQEELAEDEEFLTAEVDFKISDMYLTFFNAPEKLTVIYNGEVIQGEKAGEQYKEPENNEKEFLRKIELQAELNRLRYGGNSRPVSEWAMIVSAHIGHLMESIMAADNAEIEKEIFHAAAPMLELYKELKAV